MARDMGAFGTGTSGNPGASNAEVLAAQQAAEDDRSSALPRVKKRVLKRDEKNSIPRLAKRSSCRAYSRRRIRAAKRRGKKNKEAQVSQQNIDTQKRAASFTGVLSKGLSSAGGAILGGLSPLSPAKQAAQQTVPIPPSSGNPSGTTGVNSGGGGGGGAKWSEGDNEDEICGYGGTAEIRLGAIEM